MANAILNVGQTGGQVNISTAAAPATPAAGIVTLYAGTDKALHALNSDGVDITIAAAAAASPITVQQTNSLVSTAIGATATAGNSIVIGGTASGRSSDTIVVGQNPIACGVGTIVIGKSSCDLSGAGENVIIGNNICANSSLNYGRWVIIGGGAVGGYAGGGVSIGYQAQANNSGVGILNAEGGEGAVAVGSTSRACAFGTALGHRACSGGGYGGDDPSVAIGRLACNYSAKGAVAVGLNSGSVSSNTISIGNNAQSFPGATGTMVLGNSSVGGTGACNSVVIGNSSQATGINSVVIGNQECSSSPGSVLIGGTTNILTSTAVNNTIINGQSNCIVNNANNAFIAGSCSSVVGSGGIQVVIGSISSRACGDIANGIYSSYESCITGASYRSAVIASYQGFMNASTGAFIIGSYGCVASSGYGGLLGGNSSCVCSSNVSVIIGGDTNKILAASNCSAIIGGCANTMSGKTNTVIIGGLAITADRSNTTYVQSLIAEGQAASRTNAVGSTGGSVTLNWDNSNIQTLTLTDNITTLTKSNPIDGAVYTLFLTQGGTGGKTVSWGTDVEWPGGTPPTLSTAAGAIDAVSLIYIAGVTGYFGNANLNFS